MCDSSKWGPATWQYLHAITLNYPEEPSDQMKDIFRREIEDLEFKLPCSECQSHCKKNLCQLPLLDSDLSSRVSLIRWMIKFHNIINKMLNKPVRHETEMILYHELLSGCFLSDTSLELKKKLTDKLKKIVQIKEDTVYFDSKILPLDNVIIELLK